MPSLKRRVILKIPSTIFERNLDLYVDLKKKTSKKCLPVLRQKLNWYFAVELEEE